VGIRWNVQQLGSQVIANFEVILGADGVIQFNYNYNSGPVSATVGISNGIDDVLAEDVTGMNYANSIVFAPGGPLPARLQLTVFSAHGGPYLYPSVGDHYYSEGEVVICAAPVYSLEGNDWWACTGWTGTGSVPSSGNGTYAQFTLTENSTITWNWQITQIPTLLTFEKPSYPFVVGNEFNVTVVVENVSDLFCWQVTLNFDPNVIECVNVFIPLDNVFANQTLIVAGPDMSINGSVAVAASPLEITHFSGSGNLCTFTFMGKSAGNTSLTFANLQQDTFILDSLGSDMPFRVADGAAYSVLFQGDVNNDGVVNMRDISDAILAFNSFPGTPRWNPNADIDNSGRVDMRDIVIIVLNFGRHE
jgi:hypothetical protein